VHTLNFDYCLLFNLFALVTLTANYIWIQFQTDFESHVGLIIDMKGLLIKLLLYPLHSTIVLPLGISVIGLIKDYNEKRFIFSLRYVWLCTRQLRM